MPKKKLQLYVWEGVLTDYTDGIAFALATSPKEARLAIAKAGCDSDDLDVEPRLVSETEGFYIYGNM